MTIEQQIAALTTATTDLLGVVNVKKATLDAAISDANNAAIATAADRVQTGLDVAITLDYKEAAEVAAAASLTHSQTAETAAANAVAVVTGGITSLTPEASKIPLAGEDGKIAPEWVRGGVTATTGPGGVVRLAAGEHGDPLAGNGLDVAPPGCGTVLLDWSTVTLGTPPSGWTVEIDPTRTYAGRPALKVSATAEAGTSLIYTVSIPSTFFGGSKRLAFAVDPGDSAITGDTTKKVALWLRFADTTTHRIAMYVQPSHAVGEWFDSGALFRGDGESGQPNDHISGTAQWSKLQAEDVVSLQVVVTKPAGVAITRPVYFGPIVADPVRAETPVLSLFFDGPYSGVHKYARPIMQTYGIRSSMPLVLSRLLSSYSGIMTEAQVRQMYDLGHEVIYHSGAGAEGGWDSTTKYPDGSEYAILKAEIEEFWGWLHAHGMSRGIGYGVVGFTNGLVNTQTYERRLNISNALRDAGFLAIRQLDGYRGSYYGTGGERQTVVTGSQLVTSAQTVGDVTTILDRLEARGGWTGLTFHDLILSGATGNTINVSTFEAIALDIATRVRAGKLRVLPFSDAMRAIRASARPA